MSKYKILYIFLGIISFSLMIFVYTEFYCTGSCYVVYESKYLDPLLFGSLGLAVSVLVLLCFPGRIFISWLKHIAWWFLILTAIMVMNTSSGGFLPIVDRIDVTIFWMALLFVITTLYALIMNHHLK